MGKTFTIWFEQPIVAPLTLKGCLQSVYLWLAQKASLILCCLQSVLPLA